MMVIKSSAETIEAACNVGLAKSKLSLSNNLVLAFLAGAYIAFGSVLALKCAGGMPSETWGSIQRLVFGGVFPLGLLMVLVAGADLFTGDCMYMPGAVWRHKLGLNKFFRVLFLAYLGNFIGGLFVAKMTAYSGVLSDPASAAYAVGVANGKCALSFGVALARGVMCNWLVCLGIFLAMTATDGVSKTLMMWPPIMAFVALGFEHSIANMCFIPLGMTLGSSEAYSAIAGAPSLTASWYGFLVKNLIPVTLGNFIGGSVFVAMLYCKATGVKAVNPSTPAV